MELSWSHRGRLWAATECCLPVRASRGARGGPNSPPSDCPYQGHEPSKKQVLAACVGATASSLDDLDLCLLHFASRALLHLALLQHYNTRIANTAVMKRAAAILALAVGTAAFMRPLHPRRVDVELGAKRRLKSALSDAKKPKRASKKASAAPVRSLDEEIAKRERPEGVAVGDYLESLRSAESAAAEAIDLSKQAAALADDGAAKAAKVAAEEAEREAAAAAAETAARKAAAEAAAREKELAEREKVAAEQREKEEAAAREAEAARLAAKAEAEAKAKAEEEARVAAEKEAARIAAEKKAEEERLAEEARKAEEARQAEEARKAEEAKARGDLVLAAADAAASWPPAAAIGPLQDALARAAALGITDGNDVDAAKAAIASAERIAALAAEGAEVQPRRKAAAKAAEDWQVARKVEGLRAEGEKVISKRAEGAQKLRAYVKETRANAIVGDWADTDGMLCRLKADGTVLVPPSRGAGGTWKVVDEDGFSTSIELTLALAQTTRNGVPAGNREHTLRGSVASGTMTGTVETTMFGSVAKGDLELTKM